MRITRIWAKATQLALIGLVVLSPAMGTALPAQDHQAPQQAALAGSATTLGTSLSGAGPLRIPSRAELRATAGTAGGGMRPGQALALVGSGRATRLGRHRASDSIVLNLGLPLRNQPQLAAFVGTAASHGHYLTNAQFDATYAPTAQQVAAVKQWAAGQGLPVTYVSPDGLSIVVRGTTAQVETALHVQIDDYRDPHGLAFYAADRDATVPSQLGLQTISGLDNYHRAATTLQRAPHRTRAAPRAARAGGYVPCDFRAMYDVDGHGYDGTGQTIGIILNGAPLNNSDLSQFAATSGDTPITVGTGPDQVEWIPVNGTSTDTSPWDETAMDLEYAHGMATHSHIKYFLAASGSAVDLEAAISVAANDASLHVVSNSWFIPGIDTATDPFVVQTTNSFLHAAAVGTTFYFSSGDRGNDDCGSLTPLAQCGFGPEYPATSPYVVSVGGTTLNGVYNATSDTYSYDTQNPETAWSLDANHGGSGGGCADYFYPRPSWQTGVITAATCSGRAEPDVAAEADPSTGAYEYVGGTSFVDGGTSLATPLWAGMAAVTNRYLQQHNLPPMGWATPGLYALANSPAYQLAFHDVITGTNGFPTGPRWDEVTGWGSPDWFQLAQAWAACGSTCQPQIVPSGGGTATPFASLSEPIGVLRDQAGNVYITSDAIFTTLLTKYAPDGTQLAQTTIGGITVGELGHLAQDPGTGQIFDLAESGDLYVFDPDTLQGTLIGNVGQVPADESAIYDVATGLSSTFYGEILPATSTYGDIALLRRGNQLDAFITGISQAQTFPFVMRLRFESGQLTSDRVVVASSASNPENPVARGIAVNPQGTVLTTLPRVNAGDTTIGTMDRVVAFPADFPETSAVAPTIALNSLDVASRGMSTDAAGDFYIVTGEIGSSACGAAGSGALIVVPPDLDRTRSKCYTFGTLIDSIDADVSPSGDTAYIAIDNLSPTVYKLSLPPFPAASGTDTGSIASAGAADSYTFTPGVSGNATVGTCGIATGNTYTLSVSDRSGAVLGTGGAPSSCQWVNLTVTMGQTYTVTTQDVVGTGQYRSAWSVAGAPVTWNPSGSIAASGGSQNFSFPLLSAGSVLLATCGPPTANFDLSLLDAANNTLASSASPSSCETLAYVPPARGLLRLHEVATSGSGSWSGGVMTEINATTPSTGTPTATATSIPAPSNTVTGTNTPAPSNTATATATSTPTATATMTPTSTSTASPTATSTNTATNTPTSTATATNTSTNTATNTPTNTPTETPSNTPAATDTPTSVAGLAIGTKGATPFQSVTVTGTNFSPGETVTIQWDSATTVATTTVAGTGAFVTTFTVPQAPSGAHRVSAQGQSSGSLASASLTVKPITFLQHPSGAQGTVDYLVGFGFGATEPITALWYPGLRPLGRPTTTNTLGTFAGTSALSFTVPLSPTGAYYVVGVGLSTHGAAVSKFTVLPALYVSPSSGAHGSTATVTGTGFKANEPVTVTWDCATATCTSTTVLGTKTTNASGDFSVSTTIPTAATGPHAIGARGGTSGAFATTTYTLTS